MHRGTRSAIRLTCRSHGQRFSFLAKLNAVDEFHVVDQQPVVKQHFSLLEKADGSAESTSLATGSGAHSPDAGRALRERLLLRNKGTLSNDALEDEKPRGDRTASTPKEGPHPVRELGSELTEQDLSPAPAREAPGTRCRHRYVFLTGGTSGIGLAVAKKLASEGADRIVILTRDPARGVDAVETIKRETGLADAPVSILATEDIEDTKKALRRMSLCNTFINCAGRSQSRLLSQGDSSNESFQITGVNLHTPMNIGTEALRLYSATARTISQRDEKGTTGASSGNRNQLENRFKSYCFINVASLLASKGGYGAAAYAASKAGLIAFTRVLALEAAELAKRNKATMPAFRANVVVPGYIATPMTAGIRGRARQTLEEEIPLGRFGTPDEVADAILFLIENEYANNCVLNLDGGLSAI